MNQRYKLATVFLVVLIDLMGFGLVLPLLPFYAQEFQASPVTVGLLYSVYSLAQLIFSPIWGSYSDRVGRRPIMLLSTFGAVIGYILFGLADSLFLLFASRVLAGVMGGNISTAQAYIADITSEGDRAKGMGLIGAAFGIGFVVGPALATGLIHESFYGFIEGGGFVQTATLLEANKFMLPGFFAALMSFVSFLMVIFVLPETIDTTKDAGSQQDRHSVFTPSFWRKLQQYSHADARGILLSLLIAFFVLTFGQSTLYSAFPLFSEQELGMSAQQVGLQFFWIGLIAVFIQGYLIRYLTHWFQEEHVFLVGCGLMAVGMGLIPLADSVWSLAGYLGILAVGHSLNTPTIMSLISQESGEETYGAVMGSAQGLSGLGRMVGPTWGGFLFGFTVGLPFYINAIIIASLFYVGIRIKQNLSEGP